MKQTNTESTKGSKIPEQRPPGTKSGTLGKKATPQTHKPAAPPVVDTPDGTIEKNIEEAAP